MTNVFIAKMKALKDGSLGFRLVTDLNPERELEPGGK